jgi:hypothetical protein
MISSHQNGTSKISILRRAVLYGVLFFILSVAQCSFFSRLSFFSTIPNLVLGGVVAVALLDDQKTSVVCGIGAGFILDAIGGAGISLSPLTFMIAAIICSEISKKMLPHFLSWIMNFGKKAKIVSPDYVAEQMLSLAKEVSEIYEK